MHKIFSLCLVSQGLSRKAIRLDFNSEYAKIRRCAESQRLIVYEAINYKRSKFIDLLFNHELKNIRSHDCGYEAIVAGGILGCRCLLGLGARFGV